MTPQTILVPVDLSSRSMLGLDYAAMLAEATGASLVLFCNINLPERAALEPLALSEHLSVEEAAEAQLRAEGRARGPNIETTVIVGYDDSPAHGILLAAEASEADLIVIASHGRTGMIRWWLGSIAEKVARTAEIPVVIVPARTEVIPS